METAWLAVKVVLRQMGYDEDHKVLRTGAFSDELCKVSVNMVENKIKDVVEC